MPLAKSEKAGQTAPELKQPLPVKTPKGRISAKLPKFIG